MRIQSSSSGGLALGDADSRYLRLAGGDLTGAVTLTKAAPSLYPADSTMPPAYSVAQEWANASKTWTAFQVNVTNTASGSASKLLDLQLGGVSQAWIDKNGYIYYSGGKSLSFNGTFTAFETLLSAQSQILLQYVSPGHSCAVNFNSDTFLERRSAQELSFCQSIGGALCDWKARRGSLSEYLDITEMSAPAAPAANTARLYVEDNGSGKTRLMVLFPTGAAQVLATEP